ncbi:MAG: AlpA family phage regulatory protein [bacterium]|nr:AlpA family phage regulatory protein [bacterium]
MASELKLLRYEDLIKLTGLSRATIWRYCKTGVFLSRSVSVTVFPWRESDLIEWLNSLLTIGILES